MRIRTSDQPSAANVTRRNCRKPGCGRVDDERTDNLSSEVMVAHAIWITGKSGHMSTEAVLQEADRWAAGPIGDRARGAKPVIMESKSPLIKAFTMFQLEVIEPVRPPVQIFLTTCGHGGQEQRRRSRPAQRRCCRYSSCPTCSTTRKADRFRSGAFDPTRW